MFAAWEFFFTDRAAGFNGEVRGAAGILFSR
jgi:hypothetical protein